MRKLTPEERAAKKAALAHVHTADCGHSPEAGALEPAVVADVAEEASAEEASTEEDKPKRGRKKAEASTEEASTEESAEA